MKKVNTLTERDLSRIVIKVLKENEEEPKKEEPVGPSIKSSLKKMDFDCDLDLAEDLDDFIDENFFEEDSEPLKKKIIDLFKSCEM